MPCELTWVAPTALKSNPQCLVLNQSYTNVHLCIQARSIHTDLSHYSLPCILHTHRICANNLQVMVNSVSLEELDVDTIHRMFP